LSSLVHTITTFNSNTHIKFQVNQIVSMGVLYNSDFKNIISKKARLSLITYSKQPKKI